METRNMFRLFSLVAVVSVTQAAICDSAIADADNSLVRVGIDKDSSSVTVSGRTRVDVAAAVLRGLEACHIPADGVTVGPWLRFPENTLNDTDKRPHLTVCIGGGMEGGTTTAYIGITPKFPFAIVITLASELRALGFTDVRLLSDGDVRSQVLTQTGH
jgi:hypothetical protein